MGKGVAPLKYLVPYIFRVAVSIKRFLKLAQGKVSIGCNESSTGRTRIRIRTLTAEDFIGCFLHHALPKGLSFRRTRGRQPPG
jgi:hypothetical protein